MVNPNDRPKRREIVRVVAVVLMSILAAFVLGYYFVALGRSA